MSSLNIEDLAGVDLVYGASRYLQHVLEAPASVTIITAEDIDRFGYETLADALGGVPGFYTTYDRFFEYVGTRGFSPPGDFNRRILLSINGTRVNDDYLGGAGIGSFSLVHMDMVERIEVIRGPSSSIYGNGAFYGVINVITKTGASHPGLTVTSQVGSYEAGSANLQWGRKASSGLEVFFTANANHTGGQSHYFEEYDTPASNGMAEDADLDESFCTHGIASYKRFTLEGGLISREKVLPTAPYYAVFNDPHSKGTNTQAYVSAALLSDPAENLQLSLRGIYNMHTGSVNLARMDADDNAFINSNYIKGHSFGVDAQSLYRPTEDHSLTLGAEVRRIDRSYRSTAGEVEVKNNADLETVGGIYIQDAVRLHPLVLLHAGVRQDFFDDGSPRLSPRAGVNVRISNNLSGALVAGNAFRSPNGLEIFTAIDTERPAVKEETINTYEAMLSYGDQEGSLARLSVYTYQLQNLIVSKSDSVSALYYTNVGGVDAQGLELSGKVPLKDDGSLISEAGYSYQHARTREEDAPIPNSPKHLAFLRLSLGLWGSRAWLGTELRHVGDRYSSQMTTVDGYSVVNTTLTSTLRDRWKLKLAVRNVLNTAYEHPASKDHLQDSIPQNGRNLLVSVGYRF